MRRAERRLGVRIRRLFAPVVASLVVVVVSPTSAHAKLEAPDLQGAITFVDASGKPSMFPSATCTSIAHDHVARIRVLGSATSGRTVELAPSRRLSFDQDLCRLSFRASLPSGNAFVMSVGGVRFGTWTADEVAERGGWVFLNVRGGSTTASWRVSEVPHLHEPVPQPDNTEPINGTPFDPVSWQMQWTTIPGTADQTCATVGDETSVRAGSIIAGNFASYRSSWNGAIDRTKLWYVPLHPDGRPPLTVVAQHLDASGAAIDDPVPVLRDAGPAWSAGGHFFYATSTLLPERGSWRMTVTAGVNQGCFDLVL